MIPPLVCELMRPIYAIDGVEAMVWIGTGKWIIGIDYDVQDQPRMGWLYMGNAVG